MPLRVLSSSYSPAEMQPDGHHGAVADCEAEADHAAAFEERAQRMFDLYSQGRYGDALGVVEVLARDFPEFSARTTFWRACLRCRLGESERALELLEEGLRAGDWWSEALLRTDPDLDPLWGRADFERLVAQCESRRLQVAPSSAPGLEVIEPEVGDGPYPLLIALHGAGHFPIPTGLPNTPPGWEVAADQGWIVALPTSSVMRMPGAYAWDDLSAAKAELHQHLENLVAHHSIDRARVVLAGFSQGGRIAVRLGLERQFPASGVIALGPWIPDLEQAWPDVPATDRRVYLFVGQQDEGVENVRSLHGELERRGISSWLEERGDLGHQLPSDMAETVQAALRYVTVAM